jgi:hypothetical protein
VKQRQAIVVMLQILSLSECRFRSGGVDQALSDPAGMIRSSLSQPRSRW